MLIEVDILPKVALSALACSSGGRKKRRALRGRLSRKAMKGQQWKFRRHTPITAAGRLQPTKQKNEYRCGGRKRPKAVVV
eukprot:6144642-Pleurochrysis_carterae.AAC.2